MTERTQHIPDNTPPARNKDDDAFKRYLENLPEWDGTPRLDGLLENCFDLEDTTDDDDEKHDWLVSWASSTVMLSAVWRTYQPGTRNEMLILVGPQGCGKSSYFQQMLPEEKQQDWYTEDINIQGTVAEQVKATLGRVIVEVSNPGMAGRVDVEDVKSYLKRSEDGPVRDAYQKLSERILRRFALVGTADDLEGLAADDPGRERSWVPIKIAGGRTAQMRSYLKDNRDMLWAEALLRYYQKEPAYLPWGLRVTT